MAEQARQVFYVQDPCDSRQLVVLQGRTSGISYLNNASALDISEMPTFSQGMPSINEEHEVDDVHANRNDHDESL